MNSDESDGDDDDADADEDDADDEDDSDDDGEAIVVVQNENAEDEIDETIEERMANVLAGPHQNLKAEFLRELSENGFAPAYFGEDLSKCAEPVNPYQEEPCVSDEIVDAAKSMEPIDLFLFFMPKVFWDSVARETNRYEQQTRQERLGKLRRRLQSQFARPIALAKFMEAQREVDAFQPVQPHEILNMLGLLIARSLCPMKTGLESHYSTAQKGAIPAGTWSRFMPRQRLRDILRFLHFSDNKDPMAKKDRAWKVRPVVKVLQQTFMKGFTIGRWVAFDEMVIPSRSSRNKVRIYLKNKPHKYGTKLFAVCCGETNYCARIEVYCGSRQDQNVIDCASGPAAVLRNLKAIWPPAKIDRSQMRTVITDREYTSVALAVRLKAMGFCSIGTVQTSRLGFPKALKYPFKTIPKQLASQRGLCRLMRCCDFSDLYACSWLDNKPVYFLACGASTQKTTITRKEKNGSTVEVGCPEFIASYNKYMNGVDAHDQLRLQRYSVQRCLRWKKYYMTLFFGLLDMALVNSYIVHRQYCKTTARKPLSHAQFRLLLHQQLINLTNIDFQQAPPTPKTPTMSPSLGSSNVTTHRLEFADDKQPCGKARYRTCKVCSILHTDSTTNIGKTRSYCIDCSSEKSRVYLCDRIRRTEDGNHMTCFQIWHQLWQNGTTRQGERKIRLRSGTESSFDFSC